MPWYVFGAQAALVHGVVRYTADVDVTVSLTGTDVGKLVAAMNKAGFSVAIEDDVDGFIAATRVIPLRHRRSKIPVDVVLAGPGFEEELLSRRVFFDVGRIRIPYVSAEDLLVLKTLAGRPKDLEDIRGVILHQGSRLDLDVVRKRLRELERLIDVSDLLPVFESLVREAETRRRPARKPAPVAPAATKRKAKPRK